MAAVAAALGARGKGGRPRLVGIGGVERHNCVKGGGGGGGGGDFDGGGEEEEEEEDDDGDYEDDYRR
jgi:hypothetical protein